LICTIRNNSIFTWFVSDLDTDLNDATWAEVSNGFLLNVTDEHVGRFLKLKILPIDGDRIGPEFEVVSKNAIITGPVKCPFEDRHEFTQEKLPGSNEFRVVTYNLLADSNITPEMLPRKFPMCPSYALDISYRKKLFVKELLGYNADIMCLQEVDTKIFENDLYPVFSTKKFDGFYVKSDGIGSEQGTASFWNVDKFKLRESSQFIFREIVQRDSEFQDMLDVLNKNEKWNEAFMDKGETLQISILDSRVGNQGLILATTHIYYHPKFAHIKMLQSGVVMRILEKTARRLSLEDPTRTYSILLCGDFNSIPQSGVLEFIQKKIVGKNHPDWKGTDWKGTHLKTELGDENANFEMEHTFNMDSACGTPLYTNYTLGFKDCIDYIFYQTDSLEVKKVIPFPSEEVLSKHEAIPSQVFPSDHIACVADLKWKN